MNKEKRTLNRVTTRRLRELTRKKKLDQLRRGSAEESEIRESARPNPATS